MRIGTPATTSRGMKEAEMKQIAAWIDRVVAKPHEFEARVLSNKSGYVCS